MKSLERAVTGSPARPKPTPWGTRQSIVLLGAAITILAGTIGIWLAVVWPTPPLDDLDPVAIRQRAERLTPTASWRNWRSVRARGLDRRTRPEQEHYDERLLRYRLGMAVVVSLAAVGLVLVVAPLLTGRRSTISGYSRKT